MVDLHHQPVDGFLLVDHVLDKRMSLAISLGVELHRKRVGTMAVGRIVLAEQRSIGRIPSAMPAEHELGRIVGAPMRVERPHLGNTAMSDFAAEPKGRLATE